MPGSGRPAGRLMLPRLPIPGGQRGRHRLVKWSDWTLDVTCSRCGHIVHLHIGRWLRRHHDRLLVEVPGLLKCKRCGGIAGRVVLVDEPWGFSYQKATRFLVGWREVTPLPPDATRG